MGLQSEKWCFLEVDAGSAEPTKSGEKFDQTLSPFLWMGGSAAEQGSGKRRVRLSPPLTRINI